MIAAGVDIEEIARVENAAARYGHRFLGRIFTDREMECMPRENGFYYAVGFSMKEAVWKALPDEVQPRTYFRDIEVLWEEEHPRVVIRTFPGTPVVSFGRSTTLVVTTALLSVTPQNG